MADPDSSWENSFCPVPCKDVQKLKHYPVLLNYYVSLFLGSLCFRERDKNKSLEKNMGNSGEMPSKEIKLNLAPVKREGINTLKASCYSTICL